jgi:hypothetical protein
MTGTHHHTQLFSVEMGSQELIFARLAWNHNPPDLRLLTTTSMSHQCLDGIINITHHRTISL